MTATWKKKYRLTPQSLHIKVLFTVRLHVCKKKKRRNSLVGVKGSCVKFIGCEWWQAPCKTHVVVHSHVLDLHWERTMSACSKHSKENATKTILSNQGRTHEVLNISQETQHFYLYSAHILGRDCTNFCHCAMNLLLTYFWGAQFVFCMKILTYSPYTIYWVEHYW